MFERMGWKGVAGATPLLLLWGGMFFFAACMIYQLSFAGEQVAPYSGLSVV